MAKKRSDGTAGEVKKEEEFNKDEYILVSNKINGEMIDRIYGGGHLRMRLMQKDGTEYKGGIKTKTITVTGTNGSRFKSFVHVTDDGRWFDRGGMPIDAPKKVDEEDGDTEE